MSIVYMDQEDAIDALHSYLSFVESATKMMFDSEGGQEADGETPVTIMAHNIYMATVSIKARYRELGPAQNDKRLRPDGDSQ